MNEGAGDSWQTDGPLNQRTIPQHTSTATHKRRTERQRHFRVNKNHT